MSAFTMGGLISGFDTQSIITSMMDVERIPVRKLENQKQIDLGISTAFSAMNAKMLGLKVSSDALTADSAFQGRNVSSSDSDVVGVTVSNSADVGSYQLENIHLASANRLSSKTYTSSETALGFAGNIIVNGKTVRILAEDSLSTVALRINSVNAGVSATVLSVSSTDKRLVLTSVLTGEENSIDLKDANDTDILQSLELTTGAEIRKNAIANGASSDTFTSKTMALGSLLHLAAPAISGTVLFQDDNAPIEISVDLATDSLESIAQKINDAGSPSITATVTQVTVGGQTRYQLEVTGTDDPFDTSNFGDSNNVLETLGFLKAPAAHELVAASDATFDLNGVSMTRGSNVVSDAVTGLTFTLKQNSVPAVTLTVTENTEPAVTAIQSLVTNFNSAISYIKEQTFFNKDTKAKGLLLSDSTTRGIRSTLSGLIGRRTPMLSLKTLGELNDGDGVGYGSIRITDRAGNTEIYDLSSAMTVQDVIDAINQKRTIKITASVNSAGTGLQITDKTGKSLSNLKVEEVGGGTTGAGLGILGSTQANIISGSKIATAEFLNLSKVGITVQNDGTLALNSATLRKAIADDPDKVKALFQEDVYGVATLISRELKQITDGNTGTIQTKQNAIQADVKDIDSRIEDYNRRLTAKEAQLKAKFASLEVSLSGMQSQSNYLATQLSNMSWGG